MNQTTVTCCIAGGGPAGMMAGFLLARAGIDVLVIEKHADFLRDFRGDTIHPSTLELMFELGLLSEFLKLPHQEVREIGAVVGGVDLHMADFTRVPTHCKFLAFMPQWDFLDFLARQGRRYPTFRLLMQAEVEGLTIEGGRVVGVTAVTPEGPLDVRASLVIGADGRRSDVRRLAGLAVEDVGAPMDVLWFKLTRRAADPAEMMGYVDVGRMLVMLNRGDHWQCAFIIPKGGFEQTRAAGLPAFRQNVAALAPFTADRLDEIDTWDNVKLLTVAIDRMPTWHKPGLLCIGDAAHAMSPVGGVGINLAIQDAVAAANLLAEPLRLETLTEADLARVQGRRAWPARTTQKMQQVVQNQVISRVLAGGGPLKPPFVMTLFNRFAVLRHLAARLIGVGVRPEHVRTPDAFPLPPLDAGI
ncbi:FAD-dependent oxidoreductase [Chelatococcus reniformis]|uniref:Monooxygenase n=1 Tax=Chelatococcus reniformis TaxID=1494448 RepID=A0A916XH35_9HYPH|nr:FAD-dependent oxidoreductase [Chelatococcus reniformis]GGC71398.1 monooxygenase [Chelatococcus reniformis]